MAYQQHEYDNLLLGPLARRMARQYVYFIFSSEAQFFKLFCAWKQKKRRKAICSRHRFRCSHLKVLEDKIGQRNCTHSNEHSMTKPCLRLHTQLWRNHCLHFLTTHDIVPFSVRFSELVELQQNDFFSGLENCKSKSMAYIKILLRGPLM